MNINRTKSGIGYAAVALLAVGLAVKVSALTVTEVSHVTSRPSGAEQISGITYAGGNLFYAVDDNDNKLYPLTLAINRSSGSLTSSGITIGTGVTMSGGNDMEGCAFDPCSGNVWISQETSALIREFDPTTGTLYREAPVPAIQKKYRGNYSLEALTISGDGMTMWTANEEALTVDGLLATNSVGSVVRLTRFVRYSVYDNWTPNGEWAYETQPIGTLKDQYTRSGVAGLCALPDGTLLVLERRCYDGGLFPDFNIRVYQVNFSGATDVSSLTALNGASYTKTTKTLLWQYTHGNSMPNYEGICLGPRLDDGSCTLVLISDGGSSAEEGVFTLKLSGLNIWTMGFDAVANALYLPSIYGTNYRYLDGDQVTVGLLGEGVEAVAYTNNGATVVSAEWTVKNSSNQTLASGTGTTATFNVTGDGTLSWGNVTTSVAVSPILANDSFEAYAVGTQGSEIPGWSGEDAEVITTSYTLSAGFPMDREAHTKVLSVDGDMTRTYPEVVTNDYQKLDMAIAVRRAPSNEEMEVAEGENKLVIACDADGHMCLSCKTNGSATGWVQLSNTAYANDDWVRVELTFDYTSNGDGKAFAQVKLDGAECVTASGYASPTDLTAGGSWYELLMVGSKKCVSSLVASGMCKLDDVILTVEPKPAPAVVTFADDGAAGLVTTTDAATIASYVNNIGGGTVTVVTKPMVVSYLLGANKVLETPENGVLSISSIVQDKDEQNNDCWKITVTTTLNAADQAAGATIDLNRINGALKVVATDDLGTPFAPVDSAKFSVAPAGAGSPDAVITVTDPNAKFLKATITE